MPFLGFGFYKLGCSHLPLKSSLFMLGVPSSALTPFICHLHKSTHSKLCDFMDFWVQNCFQGIFPLQVGGFFPFPVPLKLEAVALYLDLEDKWVSRGYFGSRFWK